MEYDVIIVGSGPAGMFAAKKLAENGKKVLILEKGKDLDKRTSKDLMCGVGGTGTFSDGKLHFTPVLSHKKILDLCGKEKYERIVKEVDETFTKFGVDSEYYPKDMDKVNELVNECRKHGIMLYVRKTRHVGSDRLPQVIRNFYDYLLSQGVDLQTETTVKDIIVENGEVKGVVTDKGEFHGKNVILCPGRLGARWLQELANKYGLDYKYEKIEVGVRVEFPASVLKRFSDEMYETVFSLRTPTFDDVVRTFCPCPNGRVAIEEYRYNDSTLVCVNGYSTSKHDSPNSNFALVTEINLTEPLENTIVYGKTIGLLANTIGGGKPIIQRYYDLKHGRRSTWERINRSYITPTLKDVVPGDISMALPHRVVVDIMEGIEMLSRVLPGLNSGDTLLYAPEIKLRSSRIDTDQNLQTKIKGLYVAGDGAGISGNIVGAASSGIIAAEGILSK